MQQIFDIGMAIGPSIGYIYQYKLILNSKNVGAFSINLCGILLFANIFRINFYIFNHYEFALFIQSIIMIIVQILLMKLCVQFMGQIDKKALKQASTDNKNQNLKDSRKQFLKYVKIIFIFLVCTLLLSLLCLQLNLNIYGQMIGYISLLSQSMLIIPQIIEIYKQKRVKGLSNLLISLNLLGDILKPIQFKACGIIQIVLDLVIISQILYYRIFVPQVEAKPAEQNKVGQTEGIIQNAKDSQNDDMHSSKVMEVYQNMVSEVISTQQEEVKIDN